MLAKMLTKRTSHLSLLGCLLLTACTIGIVQRKEIVRDEPGTTATATPDAIAETTLAALQTENAILTTRAAISNHTVWSWDAYTAADMQIDPALQDHTVGGTPFIYDVAIAPDGVWVGSQYGISHFAGTWTTYTYFDGNWVNYATDESMPTSYVMSSVRTVAVAPDGTVWLGGEMGITSFDGARWTTHSNSTLLDTEGHHIAARNIAIGHDGTLWVSTYFSLTCFDGQTWTSYPVPIYSTPDGPSPPIQYDIAVAHDGSVWGAAWPDAYHFDGSAWTFYVVAGDDRLERTVNATTITDAGLEGTIDAYAVAITDDDTVWFGGGMGIASFDGTSWASYDLPSGLHNIADMALAPDGSLWAGGHGGISHFDGHNWTTYTVADGLIYHIARSIAIADDGTVWVGTESGLSRYGPLP